MMFDKVSQVGRYSRKNKRSIVSNNADKWFSRFIRARDTAFISNGIPMAMCITCGRTYDVIHEMDAGHFVKRDRKGTRYNEQNVHVQCTRCNRYRSGEEFAHGVAIDRLYGTGTAEKLYALGSAKARLSKEDLARIAEEYKQKYRDICIQKGIQEW